MICEDDFNRHLLDLIQKLELTYIHNEYKNTVKFDIDLLNSECELQLLHKLAEWKLIKIVDKHLNDNLQVQLTLTLESKFHVVKKEIAILSQDVTSNKENTKLPKENQDIKETHTNSGKYIDLRKEKIQLSKFYLRQDVKHIENSLKHFQKIGAVSNEDFQILSMNLKLLKSFISRDSLGKRNRNQNLFKRMFSKKQPTLPISGEIAITGLTESIKSLKPDTTEKSNEPKFPYKIPAGTQWHNIIIKFVDDENVEIYVKKLKHVTNFKEMGMVGKGKDPEPSEQWVFLRVLSQLNGEITVKDAESKEKYKKHKQGLTETLQNYFNIDYDPFYPYTSSPEKMGNSYKIKLYLIPPPKVAPQQKTFEDPDTFGIREYLDDAAPIIQDA